MENKNKKRIKFAMIVAIVGSISLLVGISYAIFNTVLESSKDQVIKVGSIALNFTEENGGIELLNLGELTDEEGISSDNYYSFSIENIGSNDAYYEIQLIDDPTKTNTLSANYVRANLEVDGTSKPAVNIETSGRVIYQDTITAGTTKNYKLRIWLNFGSLTTEEKQALLNQEAYFKIKIVASQIVDNNLDKSGANKPELATGMIPVYYDETAGVWKKANSNNSDETNKWYDYDNKMWANAVTVSDTNRATYLSSDAGTAISMDDINTMWVWIPRFSATKNGEYNGATEFACKNTSYITKEECESNSSVWYPTNPGAFDITFVDNKTRAHDAFTFGTQSLNGFWVGKFEISHNTLSSSTTANNLGCTSDTCSNANGIIIKPNVKSLRYNNVSNFYYANLSMKQSNNSFGFDTAKDTTLDTHMTKNNEWGAVAYLTQSVYGRCTSSTSCTEVGINNKSSFTTGYGTPAGTSEDTNNGTYETSLGKEASTTGNIYGVYDMSGGSYEYVMGNYNNTIKNAGFSKLPETKYYNLYTTSTNYTTAGLQHAVVETKGWYGDSANFVDGDYPWFRRGGGYYDGSYAGVFFYNYFHGNSFNVNSSRVVLAK